jgi:nucleoside-diphosphate-sugar epimerase
VYPDGGDDWIDETGPIHPSRYNRTVADAEAATTRFMNSGRSGVVLRFAGFYGPDARHVTDLIEFVKRGFAPIPGAPTAFISSVSHDDAAAAVVAALGFPPESTTWLTIVPSGIVNSSTLSRMRSTCHTPRFLHSGWRHSLGPWARR